jgi:hypothetical protein
VWKIVSQPEHYLGLAVGSQYATKERKFVGKMTFPVYVDAGITTGGNDYKVGLYFSTNAVGSAKTL